MFEYTQEEVLQQLDKTMRELSDEKASQKNAHTKMLIEALGAVRKSIESNKKIEVSNISREIKNSLDINRPKWIEELKKDDTALIKELKRVIDAVEKKEVVREVDIKQSSWLKAALRKNKPQDRDYTKLLTSILKEVSKDVKIPEMPKKMTVDGTVSVNPVEVKTPKWYKPESYSSSLKTIIDKLSQPLSVTLDKTIDVKLKNEVKMKDKIEVYMKDSKGRIIDLDKQFGRMGSLSGSKTPIHDHTMIGSHGNFWNNESTGVDTPSAIVDTQNYPHISIMGKLSGASTISVHVSANGTDFFLCEGLTTKINAPSGSTVHIYFTAGARYYYLTSSNDIVATYSLTGKP